MTYQRIFIFTMILAGILLPAACQAAPTVLDPAPSAEPREATPLPEPTQTVVTATPGIGTMMNGSDGSVLVYVPEGEFIMGGTAALVAEVQKEMDWIKQNAPDTEPVHTVYLDAFWIDQTEVTFAQYQTCVAEGACLEPAPPGGHNAESFWPMYQDPAFSQYPIVYVNWEMANAYCQWAGRRLPTEAEWEKAARGPEGQLYPWGNELPDLTRMNEEGTESYAVGSFPDGASPYGAMDMISNVSEWVVDWYNPLYYETSPAENPTGPEAGDEHVIRGPSFVNFFNNGELFITLRFHGPAEYYWSSIGFRCALSGN